MSLLTSAAEAAGKVVGDAAPSIKDKALSLWHKATGGVVNSVESAVGYGGQNATNLSIITRGVVHAGIHPDMIFDHDILGGMNQASLKSLRKNLMNEFAKYYPAIDDASVIKGSGNVGEQVMALSTIKFIGERFGAHNEAALAALHIHLKLFLAMDEGALRSALAIRAAAR